MIGWCCRSRTQTKEWLAGVAAHNFGGDWLVLPHTTQFVLCFDDEGEWLVLPLTDVDFLFVWHKKPAGD